MKISFVTSECVPFVKTGGLADISGALPKALSDAGHEVKVFLPLYLSVNTIKHDLVFSEELKNIPVQIGDKTYTFNAWYGVLPNSHVGVHFIDCPHFFHRGHPYTNDPDEAERFIFFQHAIFQIMQRLAWAPDVLHCNDWQSALMPAFLKQIYHWDKLFSNTVSILSIHNLAYQGRFSPNVIEKSGLSPADFYPNGPFEFHGAFSFMKVGILYADLITTVSETYRNEILTPEFGEGLEGVLATRQNDLFGVLNGIDTKAWSPKSDKLINHHYSYKQLKCKHRNKLDLIRHFNFSRDTSIPILGIISRLVSQKGFDLLQPILETLLQRNVRFVILGTGSPDYEDFFRWAQTEYPDQVAASIQYDNKLAHLITAGADMFVMPSRYEPCGMNQMYSLRYGTVPIVRKTGGLADTVLDYHEDPDNGTGFSFENYDPNALRWAIERALHVFSQPNAWRNMMIRGMKKDFSWKASAQLYERLYTRAGATANY